MRYRGAGLAHAAVRCGALWRGQHRQPQACGYLFGDGVGQCPEPARRAPIYNQMLEPKCVVACGICACSGGVFRDAYNAIGGVDRAIPVDVYAPGCAIRPETAIDAIVEACGILDQKEAVMRAGGDPLTVGGAATWDGGVELGEDGFVAAGPGLTVPATVTRPTCPPGPPHPPLQRRPSNAKGYLCHRRDRRAPVACPGAQGRRRALCANARRAQFRRRHVSLGLYVYRRSCCTGAYRAGRQLCD